MGQIFNPVIYLNPEAINIEAKIQEMQAAFKDELDWLQCAFGRAWKQYRKDGTKDYAFPAIYDRKGDYFDCFPNDTLKSYMFFSHKDEAIPVTDGGDTGRSFEPGVHNEWRHKVDLIFWFNQKKVLPNGKDFIHTELLLAQVKKVLRGIPFFTPEGVFYDPEKIFQGYDIDHVGEQYLKHPFGGFRIAGTIQYLETDAFGLCP